MNKLEFSTLLTELDACEEAVKFCSGKSLEEAWSTCERGDWMLWLYRKAKNYDFQTLTLAKGLCAETVIHLMTDERSITAVKTAIAFGRGEATREELAYAAAAAASATSAVAAASSAAAAAAAAAAYAAYAAAAEEEDATTVDEAIASKKANQLRTAEICRQVLPMPQF